MSQPVQMMCGRCSAVNRIPEQRLEDHPRCGKCKSELFTGQPVELNSGNFKRFLNQTDLPVVVDFWAPWCGPCRAMAPAYEQAAGEFEPRLRLTKLDTQAHQQPAAGYDIRSIPTLIAFVKGKEVDRVSGALSLGQLRQWLKNIEAQAAKAR